MLFAESLEAIIIDFMCCHRKAPAQPNTLTQTMKNEMKTQFIQRPTNIKSTHTFPNFKLGGLLLAVSEKKNKAPILAHTYHTRSRLCLISFTRIEKEAER